MQLWPFATTLFQRPGVEHACLLLQSEGADVCVVICALWLETHQATASPHRLAELMNVTHDWHEQVVLPLRQVRQGWREAAQQDAQLSGLREQVKQLELEAEREQLRRLEEASQAWLKTPSDTAQDWIGQLGSAFNSAAVQLLRRTAAELKP